METKVISFVNNKGGSGKSTSCSSVGYALASLGRRVLCIDCDAQMNLTLSCFPENDAMHFASNGQNIYTPLIKRTFPEEVIVDTPFKNLSLVAGSPLLVHAEEELSARESKEWVLAQFVSFIKRVCRYHYILIDSPPSFGLWLRNITLAADHLVIPLECSPWGLFGLANMLDFYAASCKLQPSLSILGALITRADERKTYFQQTVETLHSLPGVRLFDTYIHTDSQVEWAQENNRPVPAYNHAARASKEYITLAKEIEKYVN